MENKKLKTFFFLVWVVLVGSVFAFYFRSGVTVTELPEAIRVWIAQFGVWGPIVYITLNTFRSLTMFSATVFTIASSIIFGVEKAFLYTYIAENLGANLSFVVGRYFGKDVIKRTGVKLKYFPTQDMVRGNGFIIVFMMRLLFFPFDMVGYVCGAYNMRQRDFALGTALGIIPGLAAFIFLGGAFANWRSTLPLFVLFFAFGLVVAYFLKTRTKLGKELQAIKEKGS